MELQIKGRGHKVTDQDRRAADRKLARLVRANPRAVRCEIEIIAEETARAPRKMRLEATLSLPRKTFRASGAGRDVDAALTQLAERLERQLRDHAGKRKTRTTRSADRLQSARVGDDIPLD
jgi:ribosomal subunit interface protein